MRITSPLFVGRREELARLEVLALEASQGRPRVVVIGGEAGIGKSRLVAEVVRLAEERGMRVLSGAAADFGEGGLPFGPLMEALRPVQAKAEGGAQGLTVEVTELQRAVLPELRRGLTQRMFDLLLDFLERLSAESPTLLVLEDLHWADVSTREFLAFLTRNMGSLRLLVLGTYRADDLRRDHPLRAYLAELERAGRIERLVLAPFGRAELRQQLESISGEAIGDSVVERLFERSQGNPFFSEEVFAAETQGESLPPDLKEILLARLQGLPASTRTLLSAAAVAGRAHEEFLSAVTGLSPDLVTDGLRLAIDRSVLEPTAQPVALGHAFRHALLREAIYDDLLAGERVRLHRRVAQVMSETFTGNGRQQPDAQLLAQLAHHWQRAHEPREALLASWRAGEAAERALAYPEASAHFERVLDLWSQVPEAQSLLTAQLVRAGTGAPADRAYVLERAARAAGTAGELQRAATLLSAAARELESAADPDRAALIQLDLSESLNDMGDGEGADDAYGLAVALLGPRSGPAVRARVLIFGAGLRVVAGRPAEALAEVEQALAAAELAGDPRLLVEGHVSAGGALSFMGRLTEGLEHYAAARAIAAGAGLEELAAHADKWRGVILDAAARFDEAVQVLEASQEVAGRLRFARMVRHTDAVIGQALHRSGRWSLAQAALERALTRPAAEWGHVVAAYLFVGQGRFAEAEQQLAVAWESVRVSNSSASYGPYFSALAEMRIWRADHEGALQAAREGLRFVEAMSDLRWAGELTVLGVRAAAELGEAWRGEASALVDRLDSFARPRLEQGTIFEGETRAAMASARAELTRAEGRARPDVWTTAAAAWTELGEPYPAAYALFRGAEALLLERKRSAARELLSRAFETARQLDARPLLAEVESLARRGRLDASPAPEDEAAPPAADAAAQSYGLTAREREVLSLLVGGRTDRQIAEALFISPKTASVHVSNIKAKLGVEHRIEAAAAGLRLGLSEEG